MEQNSIWQIMKNNITFIFMAMAIIAAVFAISYVSEHLIDRYLKTPENVNKTRKIAVIGMFSAVASVLMLFEFPLWFAPEFYKLDLSEIPVLICGLALGPVAGVLAEVCKIILHIVFKSTTTAFVGEFSNFVIGCSFIVPASIIYRLRRKRSMAIIGVVTGTIIMTLFGSLFNVIYLLPKFAELYGLPLDNLIAMGSVLNPGIDNIYTFGMFAVVPFNLIKGSVVSVITILIYKKISIILKGNK